MENKTIEKLCYLFENYTVEQINQMIFDIEEETKNKIKSVEFYAESLGISVNIKNDSTFSKALYYKLGLDIYPQYNSTLKKYTSAKNSLQDYRYTIQQSIGDYWRLVDVETKNNTIKITRLDNDCGSTIIKEFQNGNVIYQPSEELLEKVQLVKRVEAIFDK